MLVQAGQDCPQTNIVPLGQAQQHLSVAQPDLAVVVMSTDPERVLGGINRIRQLTTGRVLAVGPVSEPRFILRVLREGADDYLDEVELDSELPAALFRLTSGPAGRTDPGATVAVLGASGGSGASTLAVNLAACLAREHKSAILVDMKLHAGDLAPLLDLKPTHTLADLCQNVSRMDRVLFERTLAAHQCGIKLLASPRQFEGLENLTLEGIGQVLALSRVAFPYTVADIDPSLREAQFQILRHADVVLFLMRLEFNALRNARHAIEYIERKGIDRNRIRLVASRQGQPKEVPAAKIEEVLGLKFFHAIPDDPKSVNRANNSGVPVVLDAPSSAFGKSVGRLATAVNTVVANNRPTRSEERSR
jgi:pilus assembly protein CpaE